MKAVITTGEGKYYSNGLDLDYMLRLPQDEMVKFSSDINKLVARLLVFPAVTIAALSGKSSFPTNALRVMLHVLLSLQDIVMQWELSLLWHMTTV